MTRPLLDPEFWKERIESAIAKEEIHRSVFVCTLPDWKEIEARQREILADKIGLDDSILDAGCAYGRLLDLLPKGWRGDYLGVDLSPDFINMAKARHPNRAFLVRDLRYLKADIIQEFDWAIAIAVKSMLVGAFGIEFWQQIQTELLQVADKILVLDYSKTDEGKVIT